MSACKPHPHYFSTILGLLGRAPEECLMVGDSVDSDMAAGKLGLKTFWVNRGKGSPSRTACDAQGSLSDLIALIETGGLDEL
jgi:FMN phosphatase YigB (HAD superfamily)